MFDHYDEFVKDGITNKRWAQNTSKEWTTVRHHLKEFNEALKYEDITEKVLSAYVLYCARDLGMLDSSIQKELSLLRWFLRWAEQKGYHSISAFIRDAILDEKLTVEICQDPVKYDYSHSIRQLITAIPTLDKRWIRAEKEFMDACNIPGVDPALIHSHATGSDSSSSNSLASWNI